MPSLQSRGSVLSTNLLLVGGLLLSFTAAAWAQDAPPAPPDSDAILRACDKLPACRAHLDNADRFYEQNQFPAALQEYQAAYALQPYPLILFNIARLHHKQNHLSDAADYYQRYLNTADPQQAERARQLLKEAQDAQKSSLPSQSSPGAATASGVSAQAAASSAAARHPQPAEQRRPRWRLITGGIMLGSGLLLSGFGAAALATNGHCQDGSTNFATCPQYYDTTGVGAALLGTGGALLLGGTVLLAIPAKKSISTESRGAVSATWFADGPQRVSLH